VVGVELRLDLRLGGLGIGHGALGIGVCDERVETGEELSRKGC